MVSVKREEDNVIIEISDDGIGIEEELKEHIFEKFKKSILNYGFKRQNEGSGLGLFIVKGIIDLHDGKIEIRTNTNEGTTFIIKIPIKLVSNVNKENFLGESSLKYISEMELSDIDKKE